MTPDVSARFEPPLCGCGQYNLPGHVCRPSWLLPVTAVVLRKKAAR